MELCLLDRAIADDDGIEERHRLAEFGTDGLDRVSGLGFADAGELVAAGLVLLDELPGEGSVLDVVRGGCAWPS